MAGYLSATCPPWQPDTTGLTAGDHDSLAGVTPLLGTRSTSTIPIVMVGVGDPLRAGFVRNLAKPGVNVTGTSLLLSDTWAKQIEIFRETLPELQRIAVLHLERAEHGVTADHMKEFASTKSIEIRNYAVRDAAALPELFQRMAADRVQALLMLANPQFDAMRDRVAEHAMASRLPSMGPFRQHAEAGFLMSYSASVAEAPGRHTRRSHPSGSRSGRTSGRAAGEI